MIDSNLLNSSIVFPQSMEITTPYNGFTKYLMQSKIGAEYMQSDMLKNFVFYEPMNKKVFRIFSNYIEDRESIFKSWDKYVFDNALYICQNIEFINEEYQDEVDDIFNQPSYDLSIFLQSVADEIIRQNPNFEICVGVVHGEQLTSDGKRYPHAHILLKEKRKEK